MSQFFQELKRRKVIKTLGVYGAAALVIIQIADTVFTRLLLPDWTVTFVIVLVILGFPLTFFLAWTYDLQRDASTDNKKDPVSKFMEHAQSAEPTATTEAPIPNNSNLSIYTITGAILACVGIGFWFFFSTSSLTSADENLIESFPTLAILRHILFNPIFIFNKVLFSESSVATGSSSTRALMAVLVMETTFPDVSP